MDASLFRDFTTRFLSVVIEALPFVIAGAFVSAILERALPAGLLKRLIPRGPLGLLAGAAAGLLFPLCECGIVPVLRRLLRKGVPPGPAVAYLFGGPIVNAIVLSSTALAFGREGPRMAAARGGAGLLGAILLGAFAARLAPEGKDLLQDGAQDGRRAEEHDAPGHGERPSLLATATAELLEILGYLVLGAALAAGINTVLHRAVLGPLAKSPAAAIPSFMGLAYLLSVCSEADAFIAASFRGFPPAAQIAFLTLGPMLDVKLTLIYMKVFRRGVALRLIPAVFLVNLALAFALHLSGLLAAAGPG